MSEAAPEWMKAEMRSQVERARRERDEALADRQKVAKAADKRLRDWLKACEEKGAMEAERDEARAEAERLKSELEFFRSTPADKAAGDILRGFIQERDEAIAQRDTLAKAIDEYEAERQRLVEQRDAAQARANEYHRRAQKAEAVIAKGIHDEIGVTEHGNLGRALANVAAYHYRDALVRIHDLEIGDFDDSEGDAVLKAYCAALEIAEAALKGGEDS